MIKGYDLMKLAADNPQKYEGKKYEVVNRTSAMYNFATAPKRYTECVIKSGVFRSNELPLMIFSDTELEEIPQSVPFLEAVKAYSEGKTIRCAGKCVAMEQVYSPNTAASTIPLRTTNGTAITDKEILSGIWFIEE